jgi:signal transduction histidine kinase
MGGEISVDSAPNRSSRFTVSLPRANNRDVVDQSLDTYS